MLGTAINVGAILAGSVIGVSIGSRLPERIRQTVLNGLGLLTMLVGLQMALGTRNLLIVLGAILLGGLLGEILRIHDGLERFGAFLQAIQPSSEGTFTQPPGEVRAPAAEWAR